MSKSELEKVLEAWEEIRDEAEPCVASQVLAIIDEALIPPTQEKVCKAIQRYYGGEVVYEKNGFVLLGYEKPYLLAKLVEDEIKFHSKYNLPPHLITLIGRFYESEAIK